LDESLILKKLKLKITFDIQVLVVVSMRVWKHIKMSQIYPRGVHNQGKLTLWKEDTYLESHEPHKKVSINIHN
jgi:hypothetical protein